MAVPRTAWRAEARRYGSTRSASRRASARQVSAGDHAQSAVE